MLKEKDTYGAEPNIIVEAGKSDITGYINDMVIENIWLELGGRVSQDEIRRAAAEIVSTAEFQNATVATFLPILIRRRTREKLKTMVADAASRSQTEG